MAGLVSTVFAGLCVFASLREITFEYNRFHAKAQIRKEKPQSKTLLKLRQFVQHFSIENRWLRMLKFGRAILVARVGR